MLSCPCSFEESADDHRPCVASFVLFISSERTKEALINHINACTEIFNALGNRIEGFQRSMIWLQDFLEVDGLNIFTTETSHIMRLNVQ